MQLNSRNLIRLPIENSRADFINGFWQWVALLANNDYQHAADALFCSNGEPWTPDVMRERVTTFFRGEKPWSVVIPNDRLVGVVNEGIECHFDLYGRA